jgi:hypothetical protein
VALGFQNSSSATFLPLLTYDARAGRMFKRDRVQGSSGWETKQEDITSAPPTFAVDFLSIEVGWAAFTPTGPNFVMAPLGQPQPAKPSPDHKNGFKLKVYGPQQLGGVREFSSSSKAVMGAIDDLHNAYTQAPEAAQGKIPVVQMTGTKPIVAKGPQGTTTNYAPVFSIVQWTDRHPDLGDATVALPAATTVAAAPTPAVVPSNHVPPPVTAAAPAGMPF